MLAPSQLLETKTMKYKVRLVFYYYDESDTTSADIYDVFVTAINITEAIATARTKVEKLTLTRANPGYMEVDYTLLVNEKVVALLPEALAVRPRTSEDGRIYCHTGETFYTIN